MLIDETISRFGSESTRVASVLSKFTPNPTSTPILANKARTQRKRGGKGGTQLFGIYIIGWVQADILAACKFGKSVFRKRLVCPTRSRYHDTNIASRIKRFRVLANLRDSSPPALQA